MAQIARLWAGGVPPLLRYRTRANVRLRCRQLALTRAVGWVSISMPGLPMLAGASDRGLGKATSP
jgi:hypothetical protein